MCISSGEFTERKGVVSTNGLCEFCLHTHFGIGTRAEGSLYASPTQSLLGMKT